MIEGASPRRSLVLSGAPASGKTTVLLTALQRAAAKGCSLRACLSLATARISEGLALGFDLALYETDSTAASESALLERSRHPLAERPHPRPGPQPIRDRMSPFIFHHDTFAAALDFLRNPVQGKHPLTVAIDEIGPLELRDGGGFLPFLNEWIRSDHGCLIVTVRPQILESLVRFLSGRSTVVELRESNRAEAERTIADFICSCDESASRL